MLYVRKGMFSSPNVASAEELNREFNRAVDSLSRIDHMMISEQALDRDNFLKPYESTRSPSSTHNIGYAIGGGAPTQGLFQVSKVTAASNLVDFDEYGNRVMVDLRDGTVATASLSPRLELSFYLADYAKVIIVGCCQYTSSYGGVTHPDFVDLRLQMVVNGTRGRLEQRGVEGDGHGRVQCGLSVLDSVVLPGGTHKIGLSVSEGLDSASVAGGLQGEITKATIAAIGLYR